MDSVDLFPIVGSLVLFSGLLLYLGRPLFSGQTRMASSGGTRRLFERKEQLLGAIVELEFDRDIGKVPAEDFMRIFAELEGEALAVMQELDQLNGAGSGELERRIEAEVAALRQTETAPHCPNCGTPWREGDLFCPQCGTALKGSS